MKHDRAIAVAQTCPVAGDVAYNVDQHVRLAGAAAANGARVVVFPELSLTGYEMGLAPSLAFTESDERIRPLADAAARNAAVLIFGAPLRLRSRLHIAAFIVYPDGTVTTYCKQRLGAFPPEASRDGTVPPAEATVFHPGDHHPLIDVDGHTAAVAICADIGRAEHPQHAASRGARNYLASMFVIPSEYDGDHNRLRHYAATHGMLVAMANYGCPTGGLAAAGRSAVWSEKGELLGVLPPAGAAVLVVTEKSGGWHAATITPSMATTR